jgi:F0F1-type ATP synthase membrane subunit a
MTVAVESWIWVLVPLAWAVVVGLGISSYFGFRAAAARAASGAGSEFQKLAEEAVRAQRQMLDEIKGMNGTLKEIEKLLSEV